MSSVRRCPHFHNLSDFKRGKFKRLHEAYIWFQKIINRISSCFGLKDLGRWDSSNVKNISRFDSVCGSRMDKKVFAKDMVKGSKRKQSLTRKFMVWVAIDMVADLYYLKKREWYIDNALKPVAIPSLQQLPNSIFQPDNDLFSSNQVNVLP